MRPEGHRQQVRPEGHRQQVRPEGHHEQVRPEGHRQQVRPEGHRQQVRPEGHHEQVRPEGHHEQVRAEGAEGAAWRFSSPLYAVLSVMSGGTSRSVRCVLPDRRVMLVHVGGRGYVPSPRKRPLCTIMCGHLNCT